MLGAYGRDVLNENGKLLLGFAEDNKLALLNTLFCTSKTGVSYTFQSTNRSKGRSRLDYILIKQADRGLIRSVNVRRSPLEAPESDHNLVYAKVHIPRRSAPNRRKRDKTKKTPIMADLRRLMADPILRCQVPNAMVAALPLIPDSTCISGVATDMPNVMLPLRSTWRRGFTRAEHRVGARTPVWRLIRTQHDNRASRRGDTYAQDPTTATFERRKDSRKKAP